MKLFLYRKVKKYVAELDIVSVANLQKKFQIGYAKAIKILDRLVYEGKLSCIEGGKYVTKAYFMCEAEAIPVRDVTYRDDFTEENVLKMLDDYGRISTASVQNMFKVGYGRAATMLDELEEKGYIENNGSGWVKKS